MTDFRSNMASSFDRVDAGEFVFINRGRQKIYAIIPIEDDDLAITPELAAKIEKARQEYREGKGISLNSREEMQKWFDSLWVTLLKSCRQLRRLSRNGRSQIQTFIINSWIFYQNLANTREQA